MAQKNIKIILLLLGFLLLAGCATPPPVIIRKPIKVNVPVYVPVTPPAYLLKTVVITGIPFFYKPNEKNVTSCLTPGGEVRLKQTIYLLAARINEWVTFASPKKVKND